MLRRWLAGCAGTGLVLMLALGCASYVRRGSYLYRDARYVEAAEVFERNEWRIQSEPARERAEYGLYRGLTMLVLGDYAAAHRWLAYAYETERARPGALRRDRRALLDRGWYELGRRMAVRPGGAAGPDRAGTTVATRPTAPQPAPRPSGRDARRDSRADRALVPR